MNEEKGGEVATEQKQEEEPIEKEEYFRKKTTTSSQRKTINYEFFPYIEVFGLGETQKEEKREKIVSKIEVIANNPNFRIGGTLEAGFTVRIGKVSEKPEEKNYGYLFHSYESKEELLKDLKTLDTKIKKAYFAPPHQMNLILEEPKA